MTITQSKSLMLFCLAFILLVPNMMLGQDNTQRKNNGTNSVTTSIVSGYSVQLGKRPPIDISRLPASAYESGKIRIKLTSQAEQQFSKNKISVSSAGYSKTGIASIDNLNDKFKVTSYKNVLDGLNTKMKSSSNNAMRHKAWGFHLWYELEIDSTVDIALAIRQFSALTEVEHVEPIYAKRMIGNVENNYTKGRNKVSTTWLPNDPMFAEQWHYQNTGQSNGAEGKDISLVTAWEIERGHPDVVVAIIDDGIQINHPDLANNIWSEIGYNFVANSSNIVAGEHGTHVAGTVAAVNNNGIGISGVAGGSGTGDGVRLMSCQVFTDYDAGGFELAPIFAADNGAAISQNSWGFTRPDVYEQIVLDAIDYFNANGGGDVMNGGITIFASGNDNSSEAYYPGYYQNVLSVSATNNRDEKAWYSNYGSWVDISAPGGETTTYDNRGVLSTVNNSAYSYLQGTSMACPHVSGVAAIIISYSHRNGYKLDNGDLWNLLVNNTDNHYNDNANYTGQLGSGRLNANKSLIALDEMLKSVKRPNSLSASAISSSEIKLLWTKNDNANDVVIVWSTDGVFGLPTDGQIYEIGETISDLGHVIYRGPATDFTHSQLSSSTQNFYRAYSYNSDFEYSTGRNASAYTLCEALPTPLLESFETGEMASSCWTVFDADGDGKGWFIAGSTYSPSDGAYAITSASKEMASHDNWLISPQLRINANNVLLKFSVKALGTSSVNEKYSVLVSSKSVKSEDFTEIYSETIENSSWKEIVIPINGYSGEEIFIAFRHWGSSGQSHLVVDEILIEEYEIRYLTLDVNPSVGGITTGGGEYYNGQHATITATPNTGYIFVNWTIDGQEISRKSTHSLEMPTNNLTITANFTDKIPSLTYAPESIEETLFKGNSITKTITLQNTGDEGSTLNVNIGSATTSKTNLKPELIYSLPKSKESAFNKSSINKLEFKPTATTTPLTTGVSVLYLSSDGSYNLSSNFKEALKKLENVGSFDEIDVMYNTPNADYLLNYDIVFVSSYFALSNSELLGNNLADYVDAGGRVCLLAPTFFAGGNFTLQGKVMTEEYSPLSTASYVSNYSECEFFEEHPITAGVNQISTSYWSYSDLQGEGVSLGTFSSGHHIAAFNSEKPIIAINVVTFNDFWSGDLMQLTQNSIDWLMQSNWITVNEEEISIAWGESYEFEITLNASNKAEGTYESLISLTTNDPNNSIVNIPVSLTVEYERFALTTVANPEDGGTVDGTGNYYENEKVTLAATANTGYMFVNWMLNDEIISTSANFEFAMPTHEVNLVAIFTDKIPRISIDPLSIEESLLKGNSINKTIIISNTGIEGSSLQFVIGDNKLPSQSLPASVNSNINLPQSNNSSETRLQYMGSYDVAPNSNYTKLNTTNYLFFDDFENGLNGWYTETSNSADLWHISDLSYSSASNALWCGILGQQNYDNGERINNSIISPIINLASSLESAELVFWENYNTELNYDFCRVDITTDDGVSWSTIRSGVTGNSEGWIQTSIDLTSFAGNLVRIRFNFDTTDSQLNNYPGWFIDDVGVSIDMGWLRFNHEEITIEGNESFELHITLDAADMPMGIYTNTISVLSNDPQTPVVNIPVSLTVEHEKFALTATSNPEDGGTVDGTGNYYENEIVTLEATANTGYMFVNWMLNDEIITTSANFEFTMPAHEVNLIANFTDQVPQLFATPISINESIISGQTETKILTISNTGLGSLNYNIEIITPETQEKARNNEQTEVVIIPNYEKGKPSKDYYSKSPKTVNGGPDSFGYSWAVTPINWIDASSGTSITLGDDDYQSSIPLGFEFDYYGQTFSTINIMSNGLVSFSNPYIWSPNCIPSQDAYGILVPFGADLDPRTGGNIYYQTQGVAPNRKFIVEYNQISIYGSSSQAQTFQVVIDEPKGDVLFQYLNTTSMPASIGIQSPSEVIGMGNCGTGDLFINPNIVESNMAIRFSKNSSKNIILSSYSGSINSENEDQIEVTLNATYLQEGLYESILRITSNDPENTVFDIPVTMNVIGVPVINISQNPIDFGKVITGNIHEFPITIKNTGTGSLNISNIETSNSSFYVSATELDVPINEEKILIISFSSSESIYLNETLTLATNDPNNSSISISLTAEALTAPLISVEPEFIHEVLKIGESVERIITINNSGGMPLTFFASAFMNINDTYGPKATQTIELGEKVVSMTNSLNKSTITSREYIRYNNEQESNSSFNILIYENVPHNFWYTEALKSIGLSYTSVSSWEELNTKLNEANNWDLVIINSYNDESSISILNTVSEYVSNGGKLIYAHWDQYTFSPTSLSQLMGINQLVDYYSPKDLVLTPDASILSSPNILSNTYTCKYLSLELFGIIVEPIGDATALATFADEPNNYAAIVLNAQQNTIFNGFKASNFSGDDSGSGKDDILELLENQISFLLSSNILITPSSGIIEYNQTSEIKVTLNSTGLEKGVYSGSIIIKSNDPENSEVIVPVTMVVETERFPLLVTLNDNEAGIVTGEGNYMEDDAVTLIATPNRGYSFINWTINDEEVSTSANFEFTMPGHPVSISANFEIKTYSLVISTIGQGHVEVNGVTYTDRVFATANTELTLEAIANDSWTFSAWGRPVSSNNAVASIIMDGNKNIMAFFSLPSSLTVNNITEANAFPNPFNEVINISNASEVAKISISNMIGVSLIEIETSYSESFSVVTNHLKEGVYLITLYNKNGETTVHKMVKK